MLHILNTLKHEQQNKLNLTIKISWFSKVFESIIVIYLEVVLGVPIL